MAINEADAYTLAHLHYSTTCHSKPTLLSSLARHDDRHFDMNRHINQ